MLKKTLLLVTGGALATCQSVRAVELDWANTGTSLNAPASYTQATVTPTASSALYFHTAEATQPVVNTSLTVAGLNFTFSGYDVTGLAGTTLTLSGYGTSATGTSASGEAAVYSTITSGNETFDVPVALASSSGATPPSPSTIYQTGAGGALIFNGVISGTTALAINLTATSTITFNGPNTYGGGTTLTGTSVANGAATLALGNDTALGTGALIFNSSNATIAATNGARTIANALTLSGPGVIGGTNNFTFTGAVNPSASQTRTLTVNNTGLTTFSGSVATSDAGATTTRLALNGSGNITITGTVANGGSTVGGLTYSGTGILTLSALNSYSGGTSVSGGSLVATTNGALGSGNVTIANGIMLTLSAGVTNAIADTATLTLGTVAGTNAILVLNGTAGTSQETVNALTVNGIGLAAGKYGPIGDLAANFQLPNITGTGELTVLTTSTVPEPSTWAMALVGAGLLGLSMRRYRRRHA